MSKYYINIECKSATVINALKEEDTTFFCPSSIKWRSLSTDGKSRNWLLSNDGEAFQKEEQMQRTYGRRKHDALEMKREGRTCEVKKKTEGV